MTAARRFDARTAAIAKVKIACKDLQIDDGAYRAMLERLTGETSAARCTEAQLGVILEELKAKGWRPKIIAGGRAGKPARKVRAADHPSAKKARALWLSLWNLGEVEDASESALEAFTKRQMGVERLQWADQGQTFKLIEALKDWAGRAGWDQHLDKIATRDAGPVHVLKRRLFVAQERRLAQLDPERMTEETQAPFLDEEALDERIAENGRHIRAHLGRSAG